MGAMNYDVVIIGAGAAGLMCAIESGRRGRRAALVEHNDRPGKKIRISGGGRCNFTNINAGPRNYISQNPHFCKSALARYTPHDFLALVERHGIAWHEKKLGQLFCDDSAQLIIDMLVNECTDAGVDILLDCRVESLQQSGDFVLQTTRGTITAQSLVIATGGLSIPKIGATDFGYRIAKQFGLKTTALKPALVPLVMSGRDADTFRALSGVSLDVIASANGTQFRENVLFTHRGVSGPAILQISSYWNPGDVLALNLLPDVRIEEILEEQRTSKKEIATMLSTWFPKSFAQAWSTLYGFDKPLNRLTSREAEQLAGKLTHWELLPTGTEGYAKAEVTLGGVATDELSSKTMEAKKAPGLFLIGEVVDVTGWLGGYNFQWAWASGYAAGQYV